LDASTGKAVLSIPVKDQTLSSLTWTPDGKQLAAIGQVFKNFRAGAYQVSRWDATSGKQTFTRALCGSPRNQTGPQPLTGSMEGQPLILIAPEGHVRGWGPVKDRSVFLVPFQGPVKAALWSPDGSRLAISRSDGTIKALDPARGKVLFAFTPRGSRVP